MGKTGLPNICGKTFTRHGNSELLIFLYKVNISSETLQFSLGRLQVFPIETYHIAIATKILTE